MPPKSRSLAMLKAVSLTSLVEGVNLAVRFSPCLT
jgi:hypothetical protein